MAKSIVVMFLSSTKTSLKKLFIIIIRLLNLSFNSWINQELILVQCTISTSINRLLHIWCHINCGSKKDFYSNTNNLTRALPRLSNLTPSDTIQHIWHHTNCAKTPNDTIQYMPTQTIANFVNFWSPLHCHFY